MSALTVLEPVAVRRVQRRTLALLMVCETLGSVALTVGFAVVGILAAELAGSTGAVGLTQASQTLGTAVASYTIAAWMNRRGRRLGLAAGYLVGALGAGLCVVAAVAGSFLVLVAGTVALGAAAASGSLSRYASTDLAPPDRRATALSLVVWTATAGAVAGPLLVPAAVEGAGRLGLPLLAGPFGFAMVSTATAGVLLFVFLRPDPLLLARSAERGAAAEDRSDDGGAATPRDLVPVIAALVLAHTTMVAVMVMTPIAMHDDGATHGAIGVAISLHFLGMFAFAPLSGILADRLDVRLALVIGGAVSMLSLAALVGAISETSATHAIGMFALGLGWSLSTVAASSQVAAHSRGDTRVQGVAETIKSFVSAGVAAASGPLMAVWGFPGLTTLAFALTVALLASTALIRTPRTPRTADRADLERDQLESAGASARKRLAGSAHTGTGRRG